MKHMRPRFPLAAPANQHGFSMIELSVAMVLAVFLLAGLFTIFQGERHTSTEQTQLTQLQDNERLAMTIITDVVQTAGYFPSPVTNSLTDVLPIDGARFPTAGQSISGSQNGSQGDNLVVRYATNPNDGVLNCVGGSNPAGGPLEKVYTQTFQVNATGQLTCQPDTGVAAVALVNNLVSLAVEYGVSLASSNANTANANCPADSYIATADMGSMGTNPALNWTNVCSVKVTLTFVNPLYQPPGQPAPTPGQLATVKFARVIGVMSRTGVDVVVDSPPPAP